MKKRGADISTSLNTPPGPTLGSIEHSILLDAQLTAAQKRWTLERFRSETAGIPDTTPVTAAKPMLLGTIAGGLLAKLLGFGGFGVLMGGFGGLALGKLLYESYKERSSAVSHQLLYHPGRSIR